LDFPRRAQEAEAELACRYWGGEAIPKAKTNLGPFILSAMMGCEMVLNETTIWAHSCVKQLEEVLDLSADFGSIWWKRLGEFVQILAERSRGKFMISLTDIHSPADHLSAIRGNQELALDLLDAPDLARHCLEHVLKFYLDLHERHWQDLAKFQPGTTAWQGWWTPGKSEIIQEDFADLLSADQYRQFIQPIDQQICDRMDQTLFHIHGTMIRHCKPIAELKGLRAIQWPSGNLRGSGHMALGPNLDEWMPHLRQIQADGKAVYLGVRADEVERVISELDPRHMLLDVGGCKSKQEVDEVLEQAVGWTQSRMRQLN
jgi:hypothetical protein